MIIDAHTHLPPPNGRTFEQQRSQYLADLQKDATQLAVLISDNILGSDIGDLDTCIRLFAGSHYVFLVGSIDIQSQGQAWLDKLDTLLSENVIFGMKIFPGHDPIYPTDPRLDPVYSLCVKYARPIIIHTGWNPGHPEVAVYNDPKHIVDVAIHYPNLPIVIAHYFWPKIRYCHDLTKGIPSIYFDTSCIADATVIAETGAAEINDVLLMTIDERPNQVLFGSDYLCCNRMDHINMIQSLDIPESLKEGIFWRNTAALYRLPKNDL